MHSPARDIPVRDAGILKVLAHFSPRVRMAEGPTIARQLQHEFSRRVVRVLLYTGGEENEQAHEYALRLLESSGALDEAEEMRLISRQRVDLA